MLSTTYKAIALRQSQVAAIRSRVVGFFLVFTFGFYPSSILGQLASHPVAPISPGGGITLSGDYGAGVNQGSGEAHFLGGRIALAAPLGGLWFGGGSCNAGTERRSTVGGGFALNVLNRSSLPLSVSLQAGAGTGPGDCQSGYSAINLISGPAFVFEISNPSLELRTWLMPRIQAYRFSFNDAVLTQIGMGVSGGVDVTLAAGFGIHVSADWATFGREEGSGLVAPARRPFYLGVGAHYRLIVPSLGQDD